MELKFLSEHLKFNIFDKYHQNDIIKNEEKQAEFIENFNSIKHRLKKKDIEDINNWNSYKKKTFIIKKNNNKITKKPINLNIGWYNLMLSNMKLIKNLKSNSYPKSKFFNVNYLFDKFNTINFLKISKIKNNTFFSNKVFLYVLIDLKRIKPIITARTFKKQVLTSSNGLTFKKLNLNSKKYKKSHKITFLTIKNVFVKLNFLKNIQKSFVLLKGLSKVSNDVVEYINKLIKNENIKTKIVFLNNYKISSNKKFKFKKIKSIKRRLKKKFIKSK